MNFELTEEQQLIRETVRDFAEREIKPVAKENKPPQETEPEDLP